MKRNGLLLALVLLAVLAGFLFLVQRGGLPVATAPGGSLASGAGAVQQAVEEPTQPASEDLAAPTPTPVFSEAPISPLPTPSPIPDTEGRLSQFQFSQTALARQPDTEYQPLLGDFLPDNETVIQISALDSEKWPGFQAIQTLNTVTGEVIDYGYRRFPFITRQPAWLDDVQMMSFVGDNTPTTADPPANVDNLWITGPGTTELADPVLKNVIASTGKGNMVIAVQAEPLQLVQIDAKSREINALPVDLTNFGKSIGDGYLKMLLHPSLPLLAFFDQQHFSVLNLDTYQLEIIGIKPQLPMSDWGLMDPWATFGVWNPTDARIALLVTTESLILRDAPLLIVLDTTTQKLTEFAQPFAWISDLAWMPDENVLMATGFVRSFTETDSNIYLIDSISGAWRAVDEIGKPRDVGWYGWGLTPDSNSERLLVAGELQTQSYSITKSEHN